MDGRDGFVFKLGSFVIIHVSAGLEALNGIYCNLSGGSSDTAERPMIVEILVYVCV